MDANSPPAPFRTSQRGRGAYPAHLAQAGGGARVPLHRRGTSQKLECLEDLLREAGFKETRIFTPEADRTQAAADVRRKQVERRQKGDADGIDVKKPNPLLRFLSGIVSWSDTENDSGRNVGRGLAKSQSLGRVAGKQRQVLLSDDDDRLNVMDAGSDVFATPSRSRRKPFAPIIFASAASSPGSSSSASSRTPPQMHRHLSQHTPSTSRNQQLVRERLDARAVLRHMISMPEFAHPDVSSRNTLVRRATEKPKYYQTVRTRPRESEALREIENELDPPLPQNWLSTITNAVMSSGPGARVGRPQLPPKHIRSHSARQVPIERRSRECVRREESLARKGFPPRTPASETTPVVVTVASVVCRSTPNSRSSSLVRNPSTRTRTRGRDRLRGRDNCMPCLGVADVVIKDTGADTETADAYSIDGATCFPANESEAHYDDDTSDEDELDFARLLVPARRQHSIQSLRRNLHNHEAASAVSGGQKAPPSAFRNGVMRTDSQLSFAGRDGYHSHADAFDDPESFLRNRHVSTDEDGEESVLADWAAHGLPGLQDAVRKKRGSLPWASRIYAS